MSKVLNPYDVELIQSGNPNLIYAKSSNGYDTYAIHFKSPTEVTCTCEGFEKYHVNCRHRKAAMFRFRYVPELDQVLDEFTWHRIKSNAEREAELDAVRNLFSGPDAA